MADNNNYDPVFVAKQAITSSSASIDLLATRNQVSLISDTDCFVNFDKPVTTNGRYLLKANTNFTFHDTNVSTVSVLGTSGNLYIASSRK